MFPSDDHVRSRTGRPDGKEAAVPETSRRRFLGGAAAAAGLAVAAGVPAAHAAAAPSTATAEERRRVVVIGSGFGGAVTALRLVEAGIPVLLLERGIRWPTGPDADTFARMFAPDNRSAWLSPTPTLNPVPPAVFEPYTGVIERIPGAGLDILCGAGVGGGSLVYHGMTLEPAEHVLSHVLPMLDHGEMHRTYYPRVAGMLRLATIPDDVLNSPQYLSNQVFARHIRAAGLTPEKIPMPIDWDFARAELRGEMAPSYTTGDVIYGVNNGGKHSLDVTYLAAAEATGLLEIATLHQVTDVARDAQGRWAVSADRIDTRGTVLEKRTIIADALFMGAGVAGTTRLLVRAQGRGTIPGLPDALGTEVGTNGDRIFTWTTLTENTGALQGGPACMGVKVWDDPATAHTVVHGPIPIPIESHTMTVIGFGVTPVRGRYRYDPVRDEAVLTYPRGTELALNTAVTRTINRIVGPLGGVLVDTTAVDSATFHPLGGAPMGPVCDTFGRVHDQRGLYVVDGSLIPGSTGACNPSMTIAALAERNVETIVRTDAGTVF
jgi:cholesterol oxidase